MRRIRIDLDGVVAEAELFEDKAPKTCARLWDTLPITDRALQTRWSGMAWRTEKNYLLKVGEVENPRGVLAAGDIIYYDDPGNDLFKVGVAYGEALWRDLHATHPVALVGRVVSNLDAFVKASERCLYEGARPLRITRA
jgi:hypothetical protein